MTTERTEADRSEIMRLHREWMRANVGLNIDGMRAVFVGGDNFQGFNLNGYTYYQRNEWQQLWRHLRGVIDITRTGNEPSGDDRIIKFVIRGDAAYLTFESALTFAPVASAAAASKAPTTMRFRGTEVYLREDESGRPQWKMWHCHYSPMPAGNRPRPGFPD